MATKYPLLLILFTLLITVHDSSCRRRPAQRCPRDELVRDNLKVKIRSNGFIAKLKCRRGYTMVEGDPNLTCLRNTWRGRVPKCIASGCEYIHTIPNGEGTYLYDDAMVRFSCSPGYELQGSSTLTCDGTFWNDTIPACVGKGITDLTCGFEDAGICGWSNDPSVEFDWVRSPGLGSSTLIGTGPRSDHTLGTPEGHFMYVDASIQRNEGEKARLYSPVYSPDLTAIRPTCFAFYFHMYGHTTGSLNVYIKREDQHARHMAPVLQANGFNPNKWMLQLIYIELLDANFQIVFEVEYSSGSMSDVAVDDVVLTYGDECAFFENLMKGGGVLHSTTDLPATTSLAAANTTTAVPITTVNEFTTTSPTTSTAPTTTTTTTTTTSASGKITSTATTTITTTTTSASAKITSTTTKPTTVQFTTPSTTSVGVTTEKTNAMTTVTTGVTTTSYLNESQTTAAVTTTPVATKVPPAPNTSSPVTTTDVTSKGTTQPTASNFSSTRMFTTTTTMESKTNATEAITTKVTDSSATASIATTKDTPASTEPISTTERSTTSLEMKPSTRTSTRTSTKSSRTSTISSTRFETSTTSTTSSPIPPTSPMANHSTVNATAALPVTQGAAGFSSIAISIIAFVVVTAVLAVIISVSVYVWRIRRQEKLPEDSEIRFLARDEVQMDGNIFSLGSRPPPRGTAA